MDTKQITSEGFLNLLCWLDSFVWPTLADNMSGITIESDIGFHCRKMSRNSYCIIVAAQQQHYLFLLSALVLSLQERSHIYWWITPLPAKHMKSFYFTLACIKGVNMDTSLSLLFPAAIFSENWEFFVFEPSLFLIFLKSQSDSEIFKVEEWQTRHRQDRLYKACFVRKPN